MLTKPERKTKTLPKILQTFACNIKRKGKIYLVSVFSK